MKKRGRAVPEILRAAMRDEIAQVMSFPREVIQNEDVPIVDRLAAFELLAKYGLGVQREVKGEMHHTHGVVALPAIGSSGPMASLPAGAPETVVEADDIEVVE